MKPVSKMRRIVLSNDPSSGTDTSLSHDESSLRSLSQQQQRRFFFFGAGDEDDDEEEEAGSTIQTGFSSSSLCAWFAYHIIPALSNYNNECRQERKGESLMKRPRGTSSSQNLTWNQGQSWTCCCIFFHTILADMQKNKKIKHVRLWFAKKKRNIPSHFLRCLNLFCLSILVQTDLFCHLSVHFGAKLEVRLQEKNLLYCNPWRALEGFQESTMSTSITKHNTHSPYYELSFFFCETLDILLARHVTKKKCNYFFLEKSRTLKSHFYTNFFF